MPEVIFHRTMNSVVKITNCIEAETIALEIYQLAYGLDSPHPWATCTYHPLEEDYYYTTFEKHLKAYSTLKVSQFGISFQQFMNLHREDMACLINVLTEEKKS